MSRYLSYLQTVFCLISALCFVSTASAEVAQLPQRMQPANTIPANRWNRSTQDEYSQYYQMGLHSKNTHSFDGVNPISPSVNPVYHQMPLVEETSPTNAPYSDHGGYLCDDCNWQWQLMPEGLIYRAYMAGMKESRMGLIIHDEKSEGWLWDIALGGRMGIFRYGNHDNQNPQGFQLDIEGAAFPRLNVDADMDLDAVDFRFGIPLSWSHGKFRYKFAYYHLSSHLGDEKLLRDGLTSRVNYSRDAVVAAVAFHPFERVRIYAETEFAFHSDVAEPWAFQFGFEYGPAHPTGLRGAPFLAINGHLRQELDFSGNIVVQTGWAWRGRAGHTLRTGLHYYNGSSNQYQLFSTFEEQIGWGLWFDY